MEIERAAKGDGERSAKQIEEAPQFLEGVVDMERSDPHEQKLQHW